MILFRFQETVLLLRFGSEKFYNLSIDIQYLIGGNSLSVRKSGVIPRIFRYRGVVFLSLVSQVLMCSCWEGAGANQFDHFRSHVVMV